MTSGVSQARATTAQEYFWALGLDDPEPAAYQYTTCYLLEGVVDREALQRCASTLVAAHGVFRTAIREIDGEPWQVVLPASDVPRFELEVIDRSHLPRGEWRAETQRIVDELLARGLDLATGRVVWATLATLGARHHALVVVFHHATGDLQSVTRFFKRLFELYSSVRAGGLLIEAPPLHYIDVAKAYEKWGLTPVGRAQSEYWRSRLHGAPPSQVPNDLPREAADRRRAGARCGIIADPMHHPPETVTLAADVREGVTRVARKSRVTIYGVYLSGLLWFLREETGQTDLCVETTLDLRTFDPRIAEAIGPHTTWTMVRVDISGCKSFGDVLPRAGQAIAEARENGPIADYYRVVPHTIRRIVLNYVPARWFRTTAKEQPSGDLTVTRLPGRAPGWRRPWDLHLTLLDDVDAVFVWTGNEKLFRRETVQKLLRRYLGILEAATR